MAKKKATKKTSKKKATKKSSGKTVKPPTGTKSGDGLIEVGNTAPAIKLNDQDGKPRQLRDYRGSWIVLYFYPKDNTSGCTKQACQFRDEMSRVTRRETVVLGISPDSEASHRKFIDKHDLNFTLLADPEQKACNAYGVWQEKSMYGRTYMGAVRTTYLIDPKGKVAHRWDKVKVADHDKTVLATLDDLRT